ncbi:hypothetical protein BC332_08107 [Capsicum chinense]|nr:hypothetical protein BC332_08107 [Capsicum chinense]
MGKATRWLRSLLRSKKSPTESSPAKANDVRGLGKSSKGSGRNIVEDPPASPYVEALDANKHAIAVAAATAAVAEAALAAAQAAAEVVRLTSGKRSASAYTYGTTVDCRREWAAVKIQSAFRAYLARRALRALKGLVKLQALVRGRIVRKQSADMLRRMQAMARIQARASANRNVTSDPSHSSIRASQFEHPGIATPRKYDPQQYSFNCKYHGPNLKKSCSKLKPHESFGQDRSHLASQWIHHWMEECARNGYGDASLKKGGGDHDESTDKILEIDTWKPRLNPKPSEKKSHNSHYSSWNDNAHGTRTVNSISKHLANHMKPNPSISSGEVSSLRSLAFCQDTDQPVVWTVEHSPGVHSTLSRPGSSSRRGPSPSRSECSRSLFGDYPGHPNYMSNTESYLAKLRSHSAPRQRMQFEKIGSTKYVDGLVDADTTSEKSWRSFGNFRNKAKPGSGQSNRVGTPDHRSAVRSSSSFGPRQ